MPVRPIQIPVRLDDDLHEELRAAARVEDVSIAGAVRMALRAWLAERRADAAFQQRLQEQAARDRQTIDRLLPLEDSPPQPGIG